jgi:hypothetical protein
VQWLIPSLVALIALVLVLGVLVSEYRAKPPILARTTSGRLLPLGSTGAPSSLWQAKVSWTQSPVQVQYGTMVIADGNLSFIPERTRTPAWDYPAHDLKLTQLRPRAKKSDIDLRLPDGRRLNLVVSKERINRKSGSFLKALSQSDHAHVFVSILAANGATCRRQ